MKIVIIGAVAGGASAAARARRLDEDCEIVLLERGSEPSFANCGLPYYVGGEIESRDKLLVAPAERLRKRYCLDVRTRSEVTSIDRTAKHVCVRDLKTQDTYEESYDKLIIATGASSFRPPIEGIDGPRVMELRTLGDADALHRRAEPGHGRAVVVGAGFIGMEVAENLHRRGMHVTIVELGDQILPPWDREMVTPIEDHLRSENVDLMLKDSAASFQDRPESDGLAVHLKSGQVLEADFAVVSIGVRPASELASAAGLECGPRGGIITDDHMRTRDTNIYAVGDVAQVNDVVSRQPTQIPLAGPANRQGRIAADHIFGRDSTYRGTQGTSVVGVFGKTAAMTGHSEKALRRSGVAFEKLYIHPSDHAGYYPGARPMSLKLLFDPTDGRILGAQGQGSSGVDKRIDVIAMAIQAGLTVYDLEEAELCYAPQYGHAKDPVNMLGFVASGVLRGDHPLIHADALTEAAMNTIKVVDVRTAAEYRIDHIDGAVNIPLDELRDRTSELPSDQPLAVYCKVGQRGYMATRILKQTGFDVRNISGGITTYRQFHPQDSIRPAVTTF